MAMWGKAEYASYHESPFIRADRYSSAFGKNDNNERYSRQEYGNSSGRNSSRGDFWSF